jgi:hypothetical protein
MNILLIDFLKLPSEALYQNPYGLGGPGRIDACATSSNLSSRPFGSHVSW